MGNKILIIDDEKDIVEMMKIMLRREGFEILTALNGKSGVIIAKEEIPDIILLDIMMPDVSGFQVCKELKEDPKTRDIPVVIISVKSSEMDITKALEMGATDYFKKPFTREVLIGKIKEIIA